MSDKKIKIVEKRTDNENKNKKTPFNVVLIILGVVFGIPLLFIILALIIGISSSMTTTNSDNLATNINNTDISPSLESIELTIDKVPITLANLYPVRVTITNNLNKSISPKFDMVVMDNDNKIICEGSPIVNDFSRITSGSTKTGELNFLGCMFNKDGDYEITITLIDSSYNKLAESKKLFNVDYWSIFGDVDLDIDIENSSNEINEIEKQIYEDFLNEIYSSTSNQEKTYSADVEIVKIQTTYFYLHRIRIKVNNKEDGFSPIFDYEVKDNLGVVVCEGSETPYNFKITEKEDKVEEISILNCTSLNNGVYTLYLDLLDPNYNILSSHEKEFMIDV